MSPAKYDALAQEIERITTCPYPSQLRTLLDLVQQCNESHISQWVALKPCMVAALTSCLIESLQHWSYVLDIIAKFALNQSCRDALLQQEPTLLHSVVVQAVKNGDTRSKYARASIALLSHPLPDTVALPAEVQNLFVQLVDEAAQHPSATAIEPVYMLLKGTGCLLLGILNSATLIQFEERLLNILRGDSGTRDPCLDLYCLYIMHVFCSSMDPEFRLTASSYNTQDLLASTPSSSRWKSEAMQQFFTGSKARKSMQLVVLVVLWASKGSNDDQGLEKVRSLILANEVITAIPQDLRKNWCAANAITVRKLQERLCAQDQDETTKILALRFFGKLCELDSLPHAVLENIERCFLEPRSIQLAHALCPRMNDCELLSGVLARASIGALLRNAVEYAVRLGSMELATGLDAVTRTVSNARTVIEQQKITGHGICAMLNDAAFVQNLQHLRDLLQESEGKHSRLQEPGWCSTAMHRMRSNLAHQISEVLLQVCSTSSISPQNMSLLLNLHASSARGDSPCSHARLSWRNHTTFGGSNGESIGERIDWREEIQAYFRARATAEQDTLTRLFTKACASLEARCEEVEQPLRIEREKRRAIEKHNEGLEKAFAELQNRNSDQIMQTKTVEKVRDQYLHDLELSGHDNKELLERVSRLEQELQEVHEQSERELAEIQDAKQMTELDSAAALARKEEELEDLQEQLEQSIRQSAMKDQERSMLQTDLATANAECNRLEETITSKDARVNELQIALHDVEQTVEDLQTTNTRLNDKLNAANSDSVENSRRLENLNQQLLIAQEEHEEAKARTSDEAESTKRHLEEEAEKITQHLHEEQAAKQNLQTQLTTAQQAFHETTTRLSTELEARNARVSELKTLTNLLQRKCIAKDHQIAEAEAMRTNLMAAMGFSTSSSTTTQNRPTSTTARLPTRSRDSLSAPPTQTNDSPPTPLTPPSADVAQAIAPRAAACSSPSSSQDSSAERTPKRPRARKAPTTRASPAGGAGKGTDMPPAARRQTLGVISGNSADGRRRAVGTVQKGKMGVARGEDGADDGEETRFDGSEVVAGTQGSCGE